MEHYKMRIAVVGLTAALSLSPVILAQDAAPDSDKTFVMQADEGNSAEIAASQMALKKSRNPEIKSYAQQMITDHNKLRADMTPIATQLGVTAPQPLNEEHKAEAKRLASLSGKDFDMEFVKAMDMDHHKTLTMFKSKADSTQNADLKTALTGAIPVVQQHAEMADQMAQKMNIPVASM